MALSKIRYFFKTEYVATAEAGCQSHVPVWCLALRRHAKLLTEQEQSMCTCMHVCIQQRTQEANTEGEHQLFTGCHISTYHVLKSEIQGQTQAEREANLTKATALVSQEAGV